MRADPNKKCKSVLNSGTFLPKPSKQHRKGDRKTKNVSVTRAPKHDSYSARTREKGSPPQAKKIQGKET